MKTLDALQKEIKDLRNKYYYIVECPTCHKQYVVEYSDFERILFEPHEQQVEYLTCDSFKTQTKIEMVSNDYKKDIYKVKCNCPCSMEEISYTYDEFTNLQKVNWDGTNNIYFELTEKESEKARAFIEKHNHTCAAKHNLTLGEYYSYNILPTGLGDSVSIECNICKETENLTDCKDW